MDNWERIQIAWDNAIARLILFKDRAVNWFSDMGTRLGFMLKRIIAVILDGIAGALNYAIERFNDIPLVPDIDWRMETGRTGKIDAERAEFEVASAKRAEELQKRSDDLTASKEERIEAFQKKKEGGDVKVNSSTVQNTTQSKSYVAVSNAPSDRFASRFATR